MASRKEYAMLFTLNAQLASGFSGTFNKAQQQLAGMQKDIQALNKTQSDIEAYQKQQQAVEATGKKLEVLQQQYDNIQKEIQETGTFSADLENKLLAKQQQIDKTSASLEGQTQKLGRMGQSLRDAGVDTSNLSKESERLAAEMGDLKKKEEEAAEQADGFGKKASGAFEAAQSALTAAGIATALKEIYEAYKQCINIAGEFEASMSNVEALSGASAEELKQLSDMAKELGATTKFTAKESADAMGYMAMAGWDAEQMLSGMPGVLSLAAASGEDLARVSDIVTDSMTAFGLTAADTTRYADVLAATAANANTSVGVMGETFKYAAPVAGALGYSIEDVSTAIGLMANAGIKGSNAGTALRNTFNGLLEGVTLTGDAFGEYTLSAVKADGTMADFSETIDELRGYFDQMTEAERVNNAMTIAGQRGYAGLLSILNASEEDYAKLTASINSSAGAAQRMADIKMDNMVGQLTLLNSASEAVKTTIGEQFTPMLADLYGWGAKVLSEINSFLQKHPTLIKGLTAAIGVIGLVVGGITAYTAAAKLAAIASAALTAAIPGLNIILGVAAGVAVLTGAIVAISAATREAESEAATLTATSREQYYQLQELREEYDAVCAAQGEYSADAQLLKRRLDEETQAFEDSKMTAEEFAQANKDLMESHQKLMDSYSEQTRDIDRNAESNVNLMNKLLELVNAEEQTAAQKQQILTLVDMLNESLPELALSYDANANALNLTADAIQAVIRAEVERERKSADREQLKNLIGEETALYEAQEAAIAERNAREAEYGRTVAALEAKKAELDAEGITGGTQAQERRRASALNSYYIALQNAKIAWDEASVAADAATAAYGENQAAIADLSQGLAVYTEEQTQASRGSAEVSEAIALTTEKVRLLTEEYNAAYEAAYSSITGQYDLWDEAEKVTAMKVADINKALESQVEHWNAYNQNLAALRERAGEIEGLSDVISSFADGSNDSVAAIAGMATASDEDLKRMVKDWQELQKAQGETSDTIAEFKTDFTEQMQALADDLAQQIRDLDLSDDAAASGRATIQGFIDAAEQEAERVQTAYARLGIAAVMAMREASGSPGGVNTHGWYYNNHYAAGTDNAAPGLALVGEEGPELVMMRGGERVLNAQRTEAIYNPRAGEIGGGYTVSFSPIYTINGSMNPEELEEVLREHDENLRAQLEELLEELAADRARRAYK